MLVELQGIGVGGRVALHVLVELQGLGVGGRVALHVLAEMQGLDMQGEMQPKGLCSLSSSRQSEAADEPAQVSQD